MIRTLTALAAALVFALGTPAQAQRALAVPATSGWQHAATGLILPARIAGMQRTRLNDSGNAELDVSAEYRDFSGKTWATLFLFRPALQSVPVWFDRSDSQILLSDAFGHPRPAAGPLAFARPHAAAASSLRRVYVPGKGEFTSTGLVVMPMGKWLVAVRATSKAMDPATLDALLSEIVAGIGWPAGIAESPVAVPIAACPASLKYARRVRTRAPDMSDALMGAAMAGTLVDKDGKPSEFAAKPVLYCRDLPPNPRYSVYRAPRATEAYVVALGDAGIVVEVGGMPVFGNSRGVSVAMSDLEGTSVYPSFDGLPRPDRVLQAIDRTSPISRASGDGKSITIGVPR